MENNKETTHIKFYKKLSEAFEIWNSGFGNKCFCKRGNEKHFYFVRYEGIEKPNSLHNYEDVVELFKKDLTKIYGKQ